MSTSSFEHIRDSECRKSLEKINELQQELRDLRDKRKEISDKIAEERKNKDSKVNREAEEIEKKIADLHLEKDGIYNSMQIPVEEQLANLKRGEELDKRQALMHRRLPLRDEINLLKKSIITLTNKAQAQKEDVTKASAAAPKKALKDLQEQEKKANEQLKKARSSGVDAVIAKAAKEHKTIETQVNALLQVESLRQEFMKTAETIEDTAKLVEKKEVELDDLNDKIDKATEDLGLNKPRITKEEREAQEKERNAVKDAKREKINDIKAKIEVLKKEKAALFNEKSQFDDDRSAIGDDMDRIKKEIDALRETIPTSTIDDIKTEFLPELIGREGCNLQQIQEDFGVLIDIDRREKKVTIRGSDAAACAEAVTQVLELAEKNRYEDSVQIDPSLKPDFIGKGGSHIEQLRQRSGVEIELQDDGKVLCIGSQENVECAIQLINDFKSNSFTEVINYRPALDVIMRPRLLRQWQEHDVRIRADQATNSLTIRGKEECVKKARGIIEEALSASVELYLPANASRGALVGSEGANLREIERVANCIVNVGDKTVLIIGSKEAVENGKKLVEAAIEESREEAIRIPFKGKYRDVLLRRHLPRPEVEQHVDPNESPNGDESPESPTADKEKFCLLEWLRLTYSVRSARIEKQREGGECILAKGSKDRLNRFERELKKRLAFEGSSRVIVDLEQAIARYLTDNMLPRGEKGMKMRIDPVRDVEGVQEVIVERDSTKVEIIGTEEGVAAGKERLNKLVSSGKSRSLVFETPASSIGRLVGPGGENLSDLEKSLNVKVVVPKDTRKLPPRADVQITIFAVAPPPEGQTVHDHLRFAVDEARRSMD